VLVNGEIDVKSTLGKGTTFTVAIDYIKSEDQTADKKADTNNNEDLPKLLIAEASTEYHKELQTFFSNKYNVYFVTTGDSVIESLYRIKYDLIILNVKLPTMDGIDTLRYIKFSENSTFEDVPIIMLSNEFNKKQETYCYDQKANGYITRPYKKEELLLEVETVLTKKAN